MNQRTAPLNCGIREQLDHNEPSMPWVVHESYETPDCTGSRRLAYGATHDEAMARAERNATTYPIPACVPYEAEVG